MSVEAISWTLNLAPAPADRGGQPSSACKSVLVALANHTAAPQGWDLNLSLAREDQDADALPTQIVPQQPAPGSLLAGGQDRRLDAADADRLHWRPGPEEG